MITKKLPGFTAEATLYARTNHHTAAAASANATARGLVVPQLSCTCDPPGSGGFSKCYCCHLNRRTLELFCYTEQAFTA